MKTFLQLIGIMAASIVVAGITAVIFKHFQAEPYSIGLWSGTLGQIAYWNLLRLINRK